MDGTGSWQWKVRCHEIAYILYILKYAKFTLGDNVSLLLIMRQTVKVMTDVCLCANTQQFLGPDLSPALCCSVCGCL